MDNDWLAAFVRLRSCIVKCGCGNETFIDVDKDTNCFNCGSKIPKPYLLTTVDKKYNIPLFPGCKLYRNQIHEGNDDYLEICGEITRHPDKPGIWGIKNLDKNIWKITFNDDSEKTLEPNKNQAFGNIKSITFDNKSIGIIQK